MKKKIDYLEEIFKMQVRLQAEIGANIYDEYPKPSQKFINLAYIGVMTEASEALEQTPWKPWKSSMVYNPDKFRKELIDLLHFVVNLFLASGMSAEDVYKAYMNKHRINMNRQKGGY